MPTPIVTATCPLPPCDFAARDLEALVADLASYKAIPCRLDSCLCPKAASLTSRPPCATRSAYLRSGCGRKPTKKRLKTPSNRSCRLDGLLTRLPKAAWVRGTVKEGSKGPIVCNFAFVRVTECRQGLPGSRVWLIVPRNVANPREVKFSFSNAPEQVAALELVRMSGLRWPVELTFEESKTELGMDQYETRSWLGWRRCVDADRLLPCEPATRS